MKKQQDSKRKAISNPQDMKKIREFVIRLGTTMHAYGIPAHRLESLLTDTTYLLGLNGTFLLTPTSLQFFFWADNTTDEYSHIVRVSPGGIDLNRLSRTHELAEDVIAFRISLEEGIQKLEAIRTAKEPYPKWQEFLCWGLTSASLTAIYDTTAMDILVSFLAGWLVYGLVLWSERSARIEDMLEPLSAILIGILGSAIIAMGFQFNINIVILAGVIAFIPGLSLTLGLRELASRELVSGTARIMDAIMMLFKLYFGAVLGLAIASLICTPQPYIAERALPQWTQYIAVLGLSTSLIVLFKVRQKDAFWGFLSGIIAYISTELGSQLFGYELGSLFGAMMVALYANIYSRICNTPSHIVLLQGIVLLVPGSKIYIGMDSAITGQAMLSNTSDSAQIFLILMSLIAGLIFANVIIPPKKRL